MAEQNCTAFVGTRRLAAGVLSEVVELARAARQEHPDASILIFDDGTGDVIDADLRPNSAAAPSSEPEETRRPGRPKLGVIAREVTLLPRHWDWLASQPGGASVALRKLVEQASVAGRSQDRVRRAQEAAYRFATAMAGNETGYEEAIRALFARGTERFQALTELWPADVRDHVRKLAEPVFGEA